MAEVPRIPSFRLIFWYIDDFHNLILRYFSLTFMSFKNHRVLLFIHWIEVLIVVVLRIIICMPTTDIILDIVIYNKRLNHKITCSDLLSSISPFFPGLKIDIVVQSICKFAVTIFPTEKMVFAIIVLLDDAPITGNP